MASLLSFYDVTAKVVPFLGSSLWQDESLSQETALIGGLFPSLTQNGYKAFVKKYEEAYGEKPLALSGYAYESVALVSMLSKKAEEEKKSFEEILLNPNGFKGIYGLFRLLPNGQVERMMNISRILPRGRFQIIQTAPVAFPKPEEEEPILEEESSLSE